MAENHCFNIQTYCNILLVSVILLMQDPTYLYSTSVEYSFKIEHAHSFSEGMGENYKL